MYFYILLYTIMNAVIILHMFVMFISLSDFGWSWYILIHWCVVCMHSIVCHTFFCMSFVYHHVSKLQIIVVMGSKKWWNHEANIKINTYIPAVILPAVYIITRVNAQICSSPTCSITDRKFTSTSQICTHHTSVENIIQPICSALRSVFYIVVV